MPTRMLVFALGQIFVAFMPFMLERATIVLCALVCLLVARRPLIIVFLAGIACNNAIVDWQLRAHWLPPEQELLPLDVTATVSSQVKRTIIDRDKYAQKFQVFVSSAAGSPLKDTRILLSDYQQREWQVGGLYHLTVKLKRPHGAHNFHTFDYEAWLLGQGILATGYITEASFIEQHRDAGLTILQLRERIYQYVKSLPLRADVKAVIVALLIGDKRDIDTNTWDALQRTGTVHLLVISGLHIGLAAGFGYALIYWFIAQILMAPINRYAISQYAAIAAIAFAVFYAGLAGFSLSTQRSLLMVICLMGGRIFRVSYSYWNGFSAALIGVLLLQPLAPLSAGFWLSFGVVGGLLLAIQGAQQPSRQLVISTQLRCFLLGIIPLSYFAQQFSILSPVVNILAVPCLALIVLPATVIVSIVSLFISDTYWLGLLATPIEWFLDAMLWVAMLPGGSISLGIMGIWTIAVATLTLILILLPPAWHFKWLALLCLPLALWPRSESVDEIQLEFFDVGQGTAILLRTDNYTLLYDTGGRFGLRSVAEFSLLPSLQARGINRIDDLVLSHDDIDHTGGYKSLIDAFAIGRVWGSPDVFSNPYFRDRMIRLCDHSVLVSQSIVKAAFLSNYVDSALTSNNDNSCVLKISVGDTSILLPGDIEAGAEQALLRALPADKLRSTILAVPHHGSKTSSTTPFIDAVAPELAIVTAGYKNRYHHPASSISQRYVARDIALMNTAVHGAIRIRIQSDGQWQITTSRRHARRIWHSW